MLGLSLPLRLEKEDKIKYAKKAEAMMVDHIWVGDNPQKNSAMFDVSAILEHTDVVELWTGVTSPFYYILDVLITFHYQMNKEYNNRFGLGLGIGNPSLFSDKLSSKSFFSDFSSKVKSLKKKEEIYLKNQKIQRLPLSIGGLGNQMIQLAEQVADILLLNSGSIHDYNRAKSLIESDSECQILPYAMCQITDKDQNTPAVFIWNIIKDIAKGLSDEFLLAHNYSSDLISEIRKLPWEPMDYFPQKYETLISDFAMVGTFDYVVDRIKELSQQNTTFEGIVLGWYYDPDQWQYIEELKKLILTL